jgi:hypothetical protein
MGESMQICFVACNVLNRTEGLSLLRNGGDPKDTIYVAGFDLKDLKAIEEPSGFRCWFSSCYSLVHSALVPSSSSADSESPKGGGTRDLCLQIRAIHFSSTAGQPSCSVRSSKRPMASAGKNKIASPSFGRTVKLVSPSSFESSIPFSRPNRVSPPSSTSFKYTIKVARV